MNNYDKYNLIIEKYIRQSLFKSAILLNAPWGSGKSYYIENYLTKFLKSKKIEIVNISLYGIESIDGINALLISGYLSKIKFLKKATKKVPKKMLNSPLLSIVKEKVGMFSNSVCKKIGLKITENDIKSIINLLNDINKKCLVIFEDVERSKINIIDLLGYIYNLIETENMKVLLVANENVILGKDDNSDFYTNGLFKNIDKETEENRENRNNNIIKLYQRCKEKTISDTINFYSDMDIVIANILETFDAEYELKKNKFIDLKKNIIDIYKSKNCKNYRILIFALQKVVDYFNNNVNNRSENYFSLVTYSTIRFAIQLKNNEESDDGLGDGLLGLDYVKSFVNGDLVPIEKVNKFEKQYDEYCDNWNKNDEIKQLFEKIKHWFEYTQNELESIIKEIYNKIKDKKIPENRYKDFMYFLLPLKEFVDCNDIIEKCKDDCLKNLENNEYDVNELLDDHIGYDGFIEPKDKRFDEYIRFRENYKQILQKKSKNDRNVLLNVQNIDEFIKYANENKNKFLTERCFLRNEDIELLYSLVLKSKPNQIMKFRTMINNIYAYANNKEIYSSDAENVKSLYEKLNISLNMIKDKVAHYLLELLINDLERIYNQLI